VARYRRRRVSTRVDKVLAAAQDAVQAEALAVQAARVELFKQWKKARQQRAALARQDINEFCAFVGKDAETGERITQEPVHETFQSQADANRRLILMAHPESGKSTQIGVLRALFLLGRNPNLRIAIVSKTQPNAAKTTRAIKSYIEKSRELAEVFPELVPGDKWGEDFFTVRRGVHSRDPSVQAVGLNGTIIGSRVDVMIFDDTLDHENTGTAAERKKTLKRIRAGFLDRLSKDGVAIFLTNAWHPEDAAHVLEKEGWPTLRVPVIDEDGTPTWPDKWPIERIEEARQDMGPLEFARAHLCKARDEGESPFDVDAIKRAVAAAEDLDLVYSLEGFDLPPGAHVYHGVDLAVSKRKKSHLTAIVTVLLWPDLSRQLLWVDAGRWSSREIRNKVLDTDRRYGGTFVVENNAAQRWILDIILNQADLAPEDRRLPELVPFTTGKNKAHPAFGVEGLAVEIDADKWLLPKTGAHQAVQQVEEMKGEALYYTRGAHTGDRLMAWWFAREGCRRGVWAGKREEEDKADLDPFGGSTKLPDSGVRIYDADDMNRPAPTPFG
jgi:hypothetical protein